MLQGCFQPKQELQLTGQTYSYNTSLSHGENEVKSPSLPLPGKGTSAWGRSLQGWHHDISFLSVGKISGYVKVQIYIQINTMGGGDVLQSK